MSDTHFETLGEAIRSFIDQTEAKRAVFVNVDEISSRFDGGVSYGQTVSRSFELLEYKGKKTKKYAHCVIYRMESGRYELTSYVL